MSVKIPLWMALAGCIASATLGVVSAQAPKPENDNPQDATIFTEYPYLPARYGEAHIPSVAEWRALQLTALGASTTRLTEEFSRQHLTCFPTRKGLVLTLDLVPQPEWKYYAGAGKFTVPAEKVKPDVEKAAKATLDFMRKFFSEVRNQDVSLRIYIRSEYVGLWENGKLTLQVEQPK